MLCYFLAMFSYGSLFGVISNASKKREEIFQILNNWTILKLFFKLLARDNKLFMKQVDDFVCVCLYMAHNWYYGVSYL